MIRYWRKAFLVTIAIITFLLFFLNLLVWLANRMQQFGWAIRNSLNFEFYIIEKPDQNDLVYQKVIQLQKLLEREWITTNYKSKQDAFEKMRNFLPDVIRNFETYNINNPFPSSLQVFIEDDEDYSTLQNVIPQFADIISNPDNIWKWTSVWEQEVINAQAIAFANFLWTFFWVLVVIFFTIIITVLFFLARILINKFIDKIELKKLLWASYWQIIFPFIGITIWLLLTSFIMMIIMNWLLDWYLQTKDFSLVFFVDIFSLPMLPDSLVWLLSPQRYILIGEIIALSIILSIIISMYMKKLILKVWN